MAYDNKPIPEGQDSDDEPEVVEAPEFDVPDDFDDEQSFLQDMRKAFADDVSADHDNTVAAKEDQRFFIGEQWDEDTKQRRESKRKPALTFNRCLAYVAQVTGHRRANQTTIKIVPETSGASKSKAKVREGIIRSAQKQSVAKIAYDKANENQVICGIGNFQVELDYDDFDVFNQSMKVCQIPDPFAVVWDRCSVDPTGADAKHVFVIDTYPTDEFKRRWPWASMGDVAAGTSLTTDVRAQGWYSGDDVRVVSYWRMRSRKATLALMQNGDIRDVTDEMEDEALAAEVYANVVSDAQGRPVMREVDRPYAEMTLCSANNILEEPYRLDITSLPVFRVPGWDITIEGRRHRFGLIRFLKDPQRLHNYWRSVVAEKLTQTPKANWLAAKSAVSGREEQWRNSHLSDDPLLIWNDDSGHKPERVEPAQIEAALLGMSELNAQDIKDISNIHEANLGMPSNEVSRVAIHARERISNIGTAIYDDNLTLAMERCGRVMNELIDIAYDAPRTLKILGEDGRREDLVEINKIGDPESDISTGKYSVTILTGPTTETKRIEAAESMKGLINAAPQTAALMLDLLVEAQDWPLADKIARRARKAMPPGMLDPEDMSPEEQQAAAVAAQGQQEAQKLAIATAVAEYMKTQSETALNAARAQAAAAQAAVAPANAQTQALNAASQAADREAKNRLKAVEIATGDTR